MSRFKEIPAMIVFGDGDPQPAIISAHRKRYEVSRARGNTYEPAFYLSGAHFGTWCLATQEGPEAPGGEKNIVWFERCDWTDEHRRLQ